MSRVVALPSGALVRGRGRREAPDAPDLTVLLADGPAAGEVRRVAWPDLGLPRDSADALDALRTALDRARTGDRVEIACAGGIGRTGTALAAMAIMDGVPRREAVAWVRQHYHPRAVETPWQRWWLRRVRPSPPDRPGTASN